VRIRFENIRYFPSTSTPRYSKWSLNLSLPRQNPLCISLLPHTRNMPHPSHSPWFNHPNILWRLQTMRLCKCNFLQSPVTSSLLSPNIFLSTLFSNTLSLCSSLNMDDQVLPGKYKDNKFYKQSDSTHNDGACSRSSYHNIVNFFLPRKIPSDAVSYPRRTKSSLYLILNTLLQPSDVL
jgi:hypothetical protein